VSRHATADADPALEAAEVFPHALAERLQSLEPVARPRGVDADALAIAMIDGREHTDLAFLSGDSRGHVGPPELVRAVGYDGPVMSLGPVEVADPVWGLEAVLPHQPPDSLPRGPDALVPEPRPDLALALAVER
jgi:hypothetical protein